MITFDLKSMEDKIKIFKTLFICGYYFTLLIDP